MSSFSFCVYSGGSHLLRVFDPTLYDCTVSNITIWTHQRKAVPIRSTLDVVEELNIGNQPAVIPKGASRAVLLNEPGGKPVVNIWVYLKSQPSAQIYVDCILHHIRRIIRPVDFKRCSRDHSTGALVYYNDFNNSCM